MQIVLQRMRRTHKSQNELSWVELPRLPDEPASPRCGGKHVVVLTKFVAGSLLQLPGRRRQRIVWLLRLLAMGVVRRVKEGSDTDCRFHTNGKRVGHKTDVCLNPSPTPMWQLPVLCWAFALVVHSWPWLFCYCYQLCMQFIFKEIIALPFALPAIMQILVFVVVAAAIVVLLHC